MLATVAITARGASESACAVFQFHFAGALGRVAELQQLHWERPFDQPRLRLVMLLRKIPHPGDVVTVTPGDGDEVEGGDLFSNLTSGP